MTMHRAGFARVSRRRFLGTTAGLLAAASLGVTRRARAAEELNALVWCDHTDPALLGPFEEAHGVKVNTKEFGTTGEAIAILDQSKPGDWDVLVLDTVDIPRLAKLGHLAELDAAAFPMADLFPEVVSPAFNEVDGKVYGVTEKFGYNCFSFDNRKVDVAVMRKSATMWDPKFKGRIAIYDYYNPVMAMVAIGLGLKPESLSKADIATILGKLKEMKRLASLVGDVATVQNALVSGSADIVVGGGEYAVAGLMSENPALDWVLPDEGGVRWMQSLAIFKASPRQALATAFVQYILSPEGQARLATSACYWAMPANRTAKLTEAQKKTLRWEEQPAFLSRSHHYLQLDADTDKAAQDAWTEFLNA